MHADTRPTLSVVVTVVEGGAVLTGCLDALAAQTGAPDLEIIVPYDRASAEAGALAARFPRVRVVPMGATPGTDDGSRSAFHEHALYEQRRATGLAAATGHYIALLEDRGWPRHDWAQAMIALHEQMAAGAIGGVVEYEGRGALRWALFLCDFGRYQRWVPEGPAQYLSDVNICYKREALERVRDVWRETYQESAVHWALRRHGDVLLLSHHPVVIERRGGPVRIGSTVQERIHWARIFAHVRGHEARSAVACLGWAAATPALPLLLFARHARRELQPRRNVARFLRAAPALVTLLASWALGECIGYCEAARDRRRRRTALHA